MTQKNIDVMDIIVSKMAEGDKLSKALQRVYHKRNVVIPYNEESFSVSLMELGTSSRATNALLRARLRTIGDVIEFCKTNKITDVINLGRNSGIEVFEAILDYCWDHMSQEERVSFLIDTVERNSKYIREEIA
jgi:DNA-directed RNA polymerase alpha subunit